MGHNMEKYYISTMLVVCERRILLYIYIYTYLYRCWSTEKKNTLIRKSSDEALLIHSTKVPFQQSVLCFWSKIEMACMALPKEAPNGKPQ